MTARAFTGGLSSLTSLNQRLIAQAADVDIDTDESTNPLLTGDDEVPADPDTGEGEGQDFRTEVRGRFSTENPLDYNRVKEWIEQEIFGGSAQGRAPLINAFVNEWADEIAPTTTQRTASGDIIRVRNYNNLVDQLVNNDEFQRGAAWLPVREQLETLPTTFRTSLEDESGNVQNLIVVNDPLRGPTFREEATVQDVIARHVPNLAPPGAFSGQPGRDRPFGVDAEAREELEAPSEGGVDRPFGFTADEREEQAVETTRAMVRRSRGQMPFIPGDQLLERLQPQTQPTGGGRRGGGTRRTLEFDKAQLTAEATRLYNRWMLSPDDAPPSIVEDTINSYIRDAKAFWSGKGVQLDFDTFVRDRFRKLPRWKHIYEHKLPGQTEEEFLQSFLGPIGGIGLRPELTRMQTEQAVTSGAGPADQAQRVSRTREAQLQPGFSQRLARTLQGVGVG